MKTTERTYQQCTRCVMDTTDPEISFDEKGQCNHCTHYFEVTSKRTYRGAESDEKLANIIREMKAQGRGKKYDCLLGISGGVDSCYTAYLLKQWGLRALLVHMDNGWDSEVAVKNIKLVTQQLGFDYQSFVLDWEEFRDLQLAFLKASVIEAETPTDIAIIGSLHQTASKYGIKYIIGGGNAATEGILPAMWHYDCRDLVFLNAIQKRFGTRRLKNFPSCSYWKESYYKFFKGIRMVYPLDYIPFSKQKAVETLETEFGWKDHPGKHYESKFTALIHSYVLPVKFDLDYRKATLSSQICSGDITREEALERLKTIPYNPVTLKADIEYVCKKLRITTDEFDAIMKTPPKTYRDYPNDEKRLKFLYNLYRKFFGRKSVER